MQKIDEGSLRELPFIKQKGGQDCGIACILMLAQYFDLSYDKDFFKNIITKINFLNKGCTLSNLKKYLSIIGIHTKGVFLNIDNLIGILEQSPTIVHLNYNHYIIVYRFDKQLSLFTIGDPRHDSVTHFSLNDFKEKWNIEADSNQINGYALIPV